MKQSFFERITGSVYVKDEQEDTNGGYSQTDDGVIVEAENYQSDDDAELAIDMYQTRDEIIIIAMTAGVNLDELDVSINNDVLSIRGLRNHPHKATPENYVHQELYWGSFSRTIVLPEEIDADKTEADMKEGLLTIRMPKIDRTKVKTLKIKR